VKFCVLTWGGLVASNDWKALKPWEALNGHEAGNGGNSQGKTYSLRSAASQTVVVEKETTR